MRRSLIVALGAALTTSAVARAEPPLTPTGKWVVDFDDAQCIASRNYGTAEEPLFFALKAPPLGSVIQIRLVHKAKAGTAELRDATLTIDQRPPLNLSLLAYTSQVAGQRVQQINVPRDEFEPIRHARAVRIKSRVLDQSFALNSMNALMKTIDACVVDLKRTWNVSEGEGLSPALRKGAVGNIAALFSDEDYPAEALRQGDSGQVRFAMLVDERGKVADCSVIETSGVAALDAQTCAVILSRAKFAPAIALNGKPAKSALTGRMRWLLRR